MVFRYNEAVGGFKHLRFKWERLVLKRPEDYFLRNYSGAAFPVERAPHHDGTAAVCPVCGFALIRAHLPNGWLIETCSALPAIPPLSGNEFKQWLSKLVACSPSPGRDETAVTFAPVNADKTAQIAATSLPTTRV